MAGKSRKRLRSKNSKQSKETKKQKLETTENTAVNNAVEDSPAKVEFAAKLEKALKMELPDDFYHFYDFCKALQPASVNDALADALNLKLCGPYDMITGKLPVKDLDKDVDAKDDGDKIDDDEDDDIRYHLHSRFYYDPPEFMTIIKESDDQNGFHIGYFRDDPRELPIFVATNNANVDCVLTPCGDNVFAAVSSYAQNLLTSTEEKSKKEKIQEIVKRLKEFADKRNQGLEMISRKMKARKTKVVTKSFHKAGIVVPLDANEVGYRPLNLTDNALKKLLDKICHAKDEKEKNKYFDELHELITLVQFANDECDYGMGLELGIDLFCYGSEVFKRQILQLLPLAYSLLGREMYGKILEKHMENREKLIEEK